ncbi:hypothetical protein CBA19CS11_32170 [Caballeronia novacaledonica]|uniref:hypothetical protein n=1 Tax=Caballeronia novacaledonica TaxID=1544861 RepID=UPI001EE389AC|nr:hypothetical protein [Caballeronia novacaledonica]GJH13594.1 hypothetical protein CBA19CS11_32170 [Caballeronia novacaledonica]
MQPAASDDLAGPCEQHAVSAGRVAHLDALHSENDLREILIVDIEENLKAFAALDIDQLTHTQLRHWAKWTGGVEPKLERAEEALRKGRALLVEANLEPLAATLAPLGIGRYEFQQFLASLS